MKMTDENIVTSFRVSIFVVSTQRRGQVCADDEEAAIRRPTRRSDALRGQGDGCDDAED